MIIDQIQERLRGPQSTAFHLESGEGDKDDDKEEYYDDDEDDSDEEYFEEYFGDEELNPHIIEKDEKKT